ncbi:MAG: ATP-binding protein [Ekhidna sp.]
MKADSLIRLIDSGNLNSDQILEAHFWASIYSGSTEEKLKYGELLLAIAQKNNNLEYTIKAYNRIGVAQRFMGNLGAALENLFTSADKASGIKEFNPLLAEIYAEISTCYTQNGDSENALLYGSKTIQILRNTDKKQELALTLLNTGYDYYLIDNYDSAMAYYNESEPILRDIKMDLGVAYIIGNRALVFWKKGDIEKAKEDLFIAIEMLKPFGDNYGMADYYNQLGNIFLEEKKGKEAIKYTTIGLKMAKQEGLKEQVRDASYLLYKLSLERDLLEDAIAYQTQHYAYKDSIQNFETTQRLANLRTEFEVGQKQIEVDLLLEQKRNNKIIIVTGSIILFAFTCLIIIIYSYLKSKNRLSKQLARQKDDLEILNETKDKFFSIISHDLRGPVSTIAGLVTVSKMYIESGENDQILNMVGKMGDSVDRLTKLLDSLLNWALQQRGHFPYNPEPISVDKMAEDVIEMFADSAKSKNIQLTYQSKKAVQILVDYNTTSTILRNLINNALKFTSSGGSVKIYSELDQHKPLSVIKIIDSGVGIPEEKLESIFSLNENISTKGTAGESGLGLGLQLVKEFVLLNKGTIDATNHPIQGSIFTLKLPLYKQ